MKTAFPTTLISLFFLSALATATPTNSFKVTFDPFYDNPAGSLLNTACSNGANGLVTKSFNTFGQLPHFPFIGGAPAVEGFNSPECGSCWLLSYEGRSIAVAAVDTAFTFNINSLAFNVLTGGRGQELGVVEGVEARELERSACGFT